jgi:hypothetical protein
LFVTCAPLTEPNADPDPDEDWAGAHACILRRLAEIALEASEALLCQVKAAAQAAVETSEGAQGLAFDPGLALPRHARSARLDLAMEAAVRMAHRCRSRAPSTPSL